MAAFFDIDLDVCPLPGCGAALQYTGVVETHYTNATFVYIPEQQGIFANDDGDALPDAEMNITELYCANGHDESVIRDAAQARLGEAA
jgi:hypothetical protein